MDILLNKKELQHILDNFYAISGLPVSFFQQDLSPLNCAGGIPPFCALIRSDKKRDGFCRFPDEESFRQCIARHKTVVYRCHAGINEAVTPIFYHGILLGYILFGGFRFGDEKISDVPEGAILKYRLNRSAAEQAYRASPKISQRQLDAYIETLNLYIADMINKKFVCRDKSLLFLQILQYVDQNYTDTITSDELRRKFGVSESLLYKMFKKYTDLPFTSYLEKLRISRAKKLLTESDATVSEIAVGVGYGDYNYFIKVFKKNEGITPLQYRKRNAGKVFF